MKGFRSGLNSYHSFEEEKRSHPNRSYSAVYNNSWRNFRTDCPPYGETDHFHVRWERKIQSEKYVVEDLSEKFNFEIAGDT